MPRFVKLNTDALLRMDPETRAMAQSLRINSRTLAVDEARQLEDMPPLTDAQIAQFEKLFGAARTAGPVGVSPPNPTPPPPKLPTAKSNGSSESMGDIRDRLLI